MFIVNQIREYRADFTESELYLPGTTRFCWVLEDVGRPAGVKIPGGTCIPEGVYHVIVNESPRFGKEMLMLVNQADGSIYRLGVRFTGVRPHGGNDVDDTDGCPLCAYHSDNNGKVWDRASDDLFNQLAPRIKAGEEVLWVISSK